MHAPAGHVLPALAGEQSAREHGLLDDEVCASRELEFGAQHLRGEKLARTIPTPPRIVFTEPTVGVLD